MQTILDQIASATLLPLGTAPTGDVGFGADLDCADDLTDTFGEVSGPIAVAQANYRRLITGPGEILDDPDYGYDLSTLIQRPLLRETLLQIPSRIEQELLLDDRNLSVEVALTGEGTDLTIDVRVESASGPYTLTLGLTDSALLLREMRAGT